MTTPALQLGPRRSSRPARLLDVDLGAEPASERTVRSELRLLTGAAAVLVVAASFLASQGMSGVLLLGLAAVPLVLAIGYRWGFALLTVLLVVRFLVDGYGIGGATSGIAAALVALGLLVALHQPRALLLLLGAAVPLALAGLNGYEVWGSETIQESIRLFSVVAVAAVVLVDPGTATRTRAARAAQLAAAAPALVALYQAATGTGTIIGDVTRSSGTLAQANPASVVFAIATLASVVLVAEGRRRWWDAAAAGAFALAAVTTGSVTGIATLVVMVLVYVVVAYGPISWPTLGTVLAMVVVSVGALLSPLGQGRLAEFFAPPTTQSEDNSLLWRYAAWEKLLRAWRDQPITGLGFGATEPGGVLGEKPPHSEYVWLLTTSGIIGVVVVAAVLVAVVVGFVRTWRRGASVQGMALVVALGVGLALNATTSNTFHFSPTCYLVALLVATAWRCAHLEADAAEAEAEASAGPRPGRRRARGPRASAGAGQLSALAPVEPRTGIGSGIGSGTGSVATP